MTSLSQVWDVAAAGYQQVIDILLHYFRLFSVSVAKNTRKWSSRASRRGNAIAMVLLTSINTNLRWRRRLLSSVFSGDATRNGELTVAVSNKSIGIGVARDYSEVHLYPPGWWKFFIRPNLQEKCVSAPQDTKCTPSQFLKEIFRTVFAGWLRFGLWGRRLKKRSSTFLAKKCTSQTKSWLRLWV